MAASYLLSPTYTKITALRLLRLRRRPPLALRLPPRLLNLRAAALNEPPSLQTRDSQSLLGDSEGSSDSDGDTDDGDVPGLDLGWLPALPHVLAASMANFLFGYHIGVMNGPIVAIAQELGFEGNSFLQGLVVSIFIAGAFIGSVSAASLIDKFGSRRTLQIDTIPLILGALLSAQAHSWHEILCGRFLVGLGIGVNTVLVPLYVSETLRCRFLQQDLEVLLGQSVKLELA